MPHPRSREGPPEKGQCGLRTAEPSVRIPWTVSGTHPDSFFHFSGDSLYGLYSTTYCGVVNRATTIFCISMILNCLTGRRGTADCKNSFLKLFFFPGRSFSFISKYEILTCYSVCSGCGKQTSGSVFRGVSRSVCSVHRQNMPEGSCTFETAWNLFFAQTEYAAPAGSGTASEQEQSVGSSACGVENLRGADRILPDGWLLRPRHSQLPLPFLTGQAIFPFFSRTK